jgi:aspartate-semialdehyde dehydrogenase
MGFKIAVVGATGNVGREMLDILAERGFPADEVIAARLAPFGQGTEVSLSATGRSRSRPSPSTTSRTPTSA